MKAPGVEFNNRATGLGGTSIYKMKYNGLFYAEASDDTDVGPAGEL